MNNLAIITDFGTMDGYVGAMKGRILSECNSNINIIDISHHIANYDVRGAAFCVFNCYNDFPEGTVFVVVVDPGVGTDRRSLVVRTSKYFFIAPDNGVLSFIFDKEDCQIHKILENKLVHKISNNFHGRDVFAPIASWIAVGKDILHLLKPTSNYVSFLSKPIRINENQFTIHVIHIDNFGNCILDFNKEDWLNIEKEHPGAKPQIFKINGFVKSFGDVEKGDFLMNWDSIDYLQIAINQGDAAKKTGLKIGDHVTLKIME